MSSGAEGGITFLGTGVKKSDSDHLCKVPRLAFLTPNFTNLAFFKDSWYQKNCLTFWLFFNIWLLWRRLAHTIRLVFWLFKYLAEEGCMVELRK